MKARHFGILAAALAIAVAPAQAQRNQRSAVSWENPVEAGSWGGVVRNGPGQSHARVASLREGERVTLLANTGVVWNEFPWFLIRFRDGQLGFMWGGILCSRGRQVEGTYQSCGREAAADRR
ncbi:MAG TPA: SH3 domain-containing protein [Allosphingosinicella sp.]|nr:SH3 domain-containing protein [Allosphingosinicella sp.]